MVAPVRLGIFFSFSTRQEYYALPALPPIARFCSGCGTAVPLTSGAQPFTGRPLVRPRIGRNIAGVCLGLAQANGWDVAVVRVITVVGFCFSGGFVGIAYLAGWIRSRCRAPILPAQERILLVYEQWLSLGRSAAQLH